MNKEWLDTDNSFKSRIIGKLLGDGSITIQKGRKPRFQFTHTSTDIGWSKYSFKMLKEYIPLNPPKFKKTIDPRLKKGFSLAYSVQSRTSPIITYLRTEWYNNGQKVIPFELLNHFFNEETLAWWYMDDGHLKIHNNKPQKVILSTDSFTIQENKWLIEFLMDRYNLHFRVDKQNRIILYDQFQIFYFLSLVSPYLHHSIWRKLPTRCDFIHELPSRRTTLYLPETTQFTSPTKEINLLLSSLNLLILDYKNGKFYDKWLTTISSHSLIGLRGYQIVLTSTVSSNLQFLYETTGLTYSQLAYLCIFLKNSEC